MTTNNNNKFEEIIKNCRETKSIADDILESIESQIEKETINSIDTNVGEQQINTVIEYYLQAINCSHDLSENKENEELKNEIEDFRINLINKRNKSIELKGRILSKDIKLDDIKNQSSEHKTLLTLSKCVVYKWREEEIENQQNENEEDDDDKTITTPLFKNVIEKQILGQGSFYLKKANDRLNYIQVKYENENENQSGIGINSGINNQTFIITSQTPILIHSKGHYVIKSDNDYYGLIFPDNIPIVYLDVLERNLSLISFLVNLPTINTATTTTTTTTTSKNEDNQFITATLEKKEEVSFVVSSIKNVSSGMESGSQSIAAGILSASAMISLGLRGGGYYLKSSLERHETPTTVSPYVVTTVEGVKGVTSYAKQGSSYIIDSLSSGVAFVGNGVVKLLSNDDEDKKEEEENTIQKQALDFGKTSIKSIGTILGAIGEGIGTIYDEATGTTVDIVNHKYGEHVAKVTDQTLSSTKDIFDTAMNIRGLGINVIKNGGKEIVNENFINKNTRTTTTTTSLISLEKESDNQNLQIQLKQHETEQHQFISNGNDQIMEETVNYKLEKSVLFQ